MFFRWLILFVFLSTSSSASADMVCQSGSCTGVPAFVTSLPDGRVFIWPKSSGTVNATTCQMYDNSRAILLEPAVAGFDSMYSMLLMSFAQQQSILIRLPDTAVDCKPTYFRLSQQ